MTDLGDATIHLGDKIGRDGEAIAGKVDCGGDDGRPRKDSMILVEIFESSQFTGHARRQTALEGGSGIVHIHLLIRRGGSCLSKIDVLVGVGGGSNEHEAAAPDARVIHANDPDAEGRTDHLGGVDQ